MQYFTLTGGCAIKQREIEYYITLYTVFQELIRLTLIFYLNKTQEVHVFKILKLKYKKVLCQITFIWHYYKTLGIYVNFVFIELFPNIFVNNQVLFKVNQM